MSRLALQCKTNASLGTVAKQISVYIKNLCDISLYQHSQYAAFDCPSETNVLVVTLEKSVTKAI